MRARDLLAAAPALLACFARPTEAQDPPPELQAQVFRVEAEVVMLDLVVRDRKGRTVRDLRPEELQVFEDGLRQEPSGFRYVDTRAAGLSLEEEEPGKVAAKRPEEGRHLNLVTLVFDQLGPDGRQIARKAALDFLELANRPDVFVSVFQVSESLKLVQQFTTDRGLVRDGIMAATGQVATGYTPATESLVQANREAEEAKDTLQAVNVNSAESAGNAARVGRLASMAEMAVNALRLTETLQREQQGRSSLFALLALSRKQQILAGRKTILFFSEGLETPPSLEHVLQAAISEANRANVSVYPVDARGLVTANQLAASRDMLIQAAMTGQRQQLLRGQVPTTREEMLIADNAEAALRRDVQGALADLAASTGGLLIANTNDMRTSLARAVGDLAGYYELAYTPTNRDYDGRFRRIGVKVSRKDVTVQTRSGYFAVPASEASVTFPYELELLRALRGDPAPRELPFRTRAFHFGFEKGSLRHTVVIEVPLRGIAFEDDPGSREDRAHFSFLGVLGGHSSLAVIKRVEPVAAGALESEDPFRLGGTRIVPYAGEGEITVGSPLNLFLVAYPEPRLEAKPELVIEFLRDGRLVARSTPELPAPDGQGRIPFVASVRPTGLGPGLYQVRALLRQGSLTADESTALRVDAPRP